MSMNLIIKLQFEALHNWKTISKNATQQYLKDPHRHIFHITIKFPVSGFDREREFIELKHDILDHMNSLWPKDHKTRISNIGSLSCEDLAQYFIDTWEAVYVQVLEDNENGAEIYYEKDEKGPHVTGDFI